jgi:hypothetical protein
LIALLTFVDDRLLVVSAAIYPLADWNIPHRAQVAVCLKNETKRHLDKRPEVRGHSPGKNVVDTMKVAYLKKFSTTYQFAFSPVVRHCRLSSIR